MATFAELGVHTHALGTQLLHDAASLRAYAERAERGAALRKRARELHGELRARKKRRMTLGRVLLGAAAPSVSVRDVLNAQESVRACAPVRRVISVGGSRHRAARAYPAGRRRCGWLGQTWLVAVYADL